MLSVAAGNRAKLTKQEKSHFIQSLIPPCVTGILLQFEFCILGLLTYSFPGGEKRKFSTRSQYRIISIRKSKPEKYYFL
jgi:hypothetical protein